MVCGAIVKYQVLSIKYKAGMKKKFLNYIDCFPSMGSGQAVPRNDGGSRNDGRRGFTMIELLVVIGIMGILATVGLDNYLISQKKARDTQRKSDLNNIGKALESYYQDYGKYPLSGTGGEQGLILGCGNGGGAACVWDGRSPFATNKQTYMTRLPTDPVSGNTYFYYSDGMSFDLYSPLENNQDKAFRGSVDECGLLRTSTCICGSVNCNYKLTDQGVEMP